jgi:hypothetical protein
LSTTANPLTAGASALAAPQPFSHPCANVPCRILGRLSSVGCGDTGERKCNGGSIFGMLWEGLGLWIAGGLGITVVVECAGVGGRIARSPRVVPKAPPREPAKRSAKVLHGASPQRITVVLGALVMPRRSTALRGAEPTGRQPYTAHAAHPTTPHPTRLLEGGDEIGRQRVQRSARFCARCAVRSRSWAAVGPRPTNWRPPKSCRRVGSAAPSTW